MFPAPPQEEEPPHTSSWRSSPHNLDDAELIARIRASKQGDLFARLFYAGDISGHGDDDSKADCALAGLLMWWSGGDDDQADRLFRASALMRDKWDSTRGESTYGRDTLRKVAPRDGGYSPGGTGTMPRRSDAPPRADAEGAPHADDEPSAEPLPDPVATGSDPVELNDTGNARRLVALHGDDIRYVIDRGHWLVWNGTHWQRDTKGVELLRRSKGVSGVVDAEVAACPNDDRRKILRKWATTSGEEPRRERMIELARAEIEVGVYAADLDRDPWALNVLNGTIDLRTGVLGPHRHRDLITKLAPVLFDPEARSARFEGFLARVLPDPAVREYIRRCIGYMLTGLTTEEKWFLVYGPPAGGKSTLFEALRRLLGDYACMISSDAFMKRKDPGASNPEIARLEGIRFAVAFEVTRGRVIDEGLVKSLTGGDPVKGREFYTGPITFQPACKLVIAANDRPKLRDDDDGMWRRVLELPFPLSIPEAERDLTLKPELLDVPRSGPAILAWAVRGCLAWQRDGLTPPSAVRAATAAYRSEMDLVGQFLEDACKRSDDGWTSTKQLVEAFGRGPPRTAFSPTRRVSSVSASSATASPRRNPAREPKPGDGGASRSWIRGDAGVCGRFAEIRRAFRTPFTTSLSCARAHERVCKFDPRNARIEIKRRFRNARIRPLAATPPSEPPPHARNDQMNVQTPPAAVDHMPSRRGRTPVGTPTRQRPARW